MLKDIKKKSLFVLALFAFGFVINSCSSSPKSLAPKDIEDYVISFYSEKLKEVDAPYLHMTGYYNFENGETYTLTLNGKVIEEGSYSYTRTSPNTASLLLSYLYGSQDYDYLSTLHFSNPYSGKWNSNYDNEEIDNESGTFKVLRHGFK